MLFQALGAVKDNENILKLHRLNGVTKCSTALVLSGLLSANISENVCGRVLFKKASKIIIFCSCIKSGNFSMLYFINMPFEGNRYGFLSIILAALFLEQNYFL